MFTGMWNKIQRLLPHGAILICNMYIVFYLIDRVNKAMCFIDNGLTKGLLAIMCFISIFNSLALITARPQMRRSAHVNESVRPMGPARTGRAAPNGNYGYSMREPAYRQQRPYRQERAYPQGQNYHRQEQTYSQDQAYRQERDQDQGRLMEWQDYSPQQDRSTRRKAS